MAFGFFKKILQKVDQIVTGRGKIDEDLFEELEEELIQADVNIGTTQMVLRELRQAVQDERMSGGDEVIAKLKAKLTATLEKAGGEQGSRLKVAPTAPTMYLIVGVNGVGKTTTIAKLAYMLQRQGKKVVLAAGDTFRAAAIDQLEIWAGLSLIHI